MISTAHVRSSFSLFIVRLPPMVTLQLRQLDVPPGQRLLLHDVSWDEFEAILAELGEPVAIPFKDADPSLAKL